MCFSFYICVDFMSLGYLKIDQQRVKYILIPEAYPLFHLLLSDLPIWCPRPQREVLWGRGRSRNNMTCYPKWKHKHRSLSKMSMISELKCRHTLKRSIGKKKNWPASQISLNPTGLGDDGDQRHVATGQRTGRNWHLQACWKLAKWTTPSKSKLKVNMGE